MLGMKKMAAIAAAAAITSGCVMFHMADTGIKHSMLVHAASAEDLTFQIVSVADGVEPSWAFDMENEINGLTTKMVYIYTATAVRTSGSGGIPVATQPTDPPPEPYRYAVLTACDPYAAGTLEIPSEYNGVPVKAIDNGAFSNKCYDLTKIVVPDSVRVIRQNAFRGCEGLKEVVLPRTLNGIAPYTFQNCISLTQLIIPEGVIGIGVGAFAGCKALKSVTLPDSLEKFGEQQYTSYGIFENCTSLERITLPPYAPAIPDNMFKQCTSLKTIVIPESVRRIGEHVFQGCTGLTKLTVPKSVTTIRKGAFTGCDALYKLEILNPECVISALWDYQKLPNLVLYGDWESTAHTFADEQGVQFVPLSDVPPVQEEDPLPLAPEGAVFGDVDGDKDITAADAQYVLQFYVEKMTGNKPTWYGVTGNVNAPA